MAERYHVPNELPEFLSHEMTYAIHCASGHCTRDKTSSLWQRPVQRYGPGITRLQYLAI